MDAVALLQELVSIPSLSGEEAAAVEFLVTQMDALGLVGHIDTVGNAVGVRTSPDAAGQISREIVLLGHIDTVPGDLPVRVADGKQYGRGSVDAKGPLAAFVIAAAQADLPAGTRVIVIGAVEEEAATSRGAYHVAGRYRPDACIIGEPSGATGVTLGYKGRLLLEGVWQQPMGHTAGPGVMVAETAVAFWNEVRAYADRCNEGETRLFAQLLPALRRIHTASDGRVDRAIMQIGLRLPPEFDQEAFFVWASAHAGTAQLSNTGYVPAFQTRRTNPLARCFNRALRQTGATPRFKVKTGTSDMNVVGPAWECPIVAYGPGDSSLDHTPQEHLELAEYAQAIQVLKTVLETFT